MNYRLLERSGSPPIFSPDAFVPVFCLLSFIYGLSTVDYGLFLYLYSHYLQKNKDFCKIFKVLSSKLSERKKIS